MKSFGIWSSLYHQAILSPSWFCRNVIPSEVIVISTGKEKKKLAYVCKHHRRDFQQPGNGREGDRNEAEAICFPTQPKTMKTSIIFLSGLLFPLSCLAHVPLSNRKHFLHVFHQPISWHLWFFISEMFSEDFYAFVG